MPVAARALRNARGLFGTLALGFLHCEPPAKPAEPEAKASPNATIVPQPLMSGKRGAKAAPSASALSRKSARATTRTLIPEPFDPHQPTPRSAPTDEPLKSTPGLILEAHFDWPDLPRHIPPLYGLKKPEMVEIREQAQARVRVDLLVEDEMVLSISTRALPLPEKTELVGDGAHFGFQLLWPSRDHYRVLPQGSFRALLNELRADTTPLLTPLVRSSESGRRFGFPSDKTEVTSNYGRLTLEQVTVDGLGYGGTVLCRLLLEPIGVAPNSSACAADRIPVTADYAFENGARLRFVVDEMVPRAETTPAKPVKGPRNPIPKRAEFVRSGLPTPEGTPLSPEQRAALRPGSKDFKPATLTTRNRTELAAHIVVDGLSVGMVAPRSISRLGGFRPGNYRIEYRTFLGEVVQDATEVTLPGQVLLGEAETDAGAPRVP